MHNHIAAKSIPTYFKKSGIYTYYYLIHIFKRYVPNRMPTQRQKQIVVKKNIKSQRLNLIPFSRKL